MGNNNILPFGKNAVVGQNGGVLSQSDYAADSQRTNGQSGIGRSQLNNKALRNIAYPSVGLAQFVANRVPGDVDDSNSLDIFETDLVSAIQIASKEITPTWKPNASYDAGNICYATTQENSYKIMECVTGGTSGDSEPSWGGVGTYEPDGTAKWIICDFMDGTPVARVVNDVVVRPGYIKYNGAAVNRSDFPRLVAFATKYNLWTSDTANFPGFFGTGNGSTTMTLPDYRGVFQRFLDENKGYDPGRSLAGFQKGSLLSGDDTGDSTPSSLGPSISQVSKGWDPFLSTNYAGVFACYLAAASPVRAISYAGEGVARPYNISGYAMGRY